MSPLRGRGASGDELIGVMELVGKMPFARKASGKVQERLAAAAFPPEDREPLTLASRTADGLRFVVIGRACFRLVGEDAGKIQDGLVEVIDMVDEELAAGALAVVEERAGAYRIPSEDGELGLLTGWTGDVQGEGIDMRLQHER